MANRRPGNVRNNATHHQPDEHGRIDIYDLLDPANSLGRNIGTNLTSHYTSAVPFIPYMHPWGDGQQLPTADIRSRTLTYTPTMPRVNSSNSVNGIQHMPFNGMAQQPQRSQVQMAPPTAITNGSSMFQGSGIVNPMAQAFAVGSQASQQAMWSANMPIKPALVPGPTRNGNHPYTGNPYTQARFEAPNHSTPTTTNVAQDIRVNSPRIPISTPPPPQRPTPTTKRRPSEQAQPPQKRQQSQQPPEPEEPKQAEAVPPFPYGLDRIYAERPIQPTPTTKRRQSEEAQPPQKRQQFQQPPEPEEPKQAEAIPLLPYGLDRIYAENQRMEAVEREQEKREQEKREKGQQSTPQAQKPSEQAWDESRWPGDTSNFPCEAFANIELPESKYRATTIHVGTPKSATRYTVGVYAVRPAGYNIFEYRIARDGADMQTVARGELIPFHEIVLNKYFAGMKRSKVEDWIRCLMALVPGCDNALMRWKRVGGGDGSTTEAPNGQQGH